MKFLKYIKECWAWFTTYESSPNFEVKIILDSVSKSGSRLTTFQLKYPRFIHSELMTHRDLSRNASSSRAIPVAKMIAQVWHNPAMPVHWGANQPGMKAREQLLGRRLAISKFLWKAAARNACIVAYLLSKTKLHKQVANRILEPWQHIHVIVSATNLDNFFQLRCHKDAQPEFQHLATLMHDVYLFSTPAEREWHLPYVTEDEHETSSIETLIKFSVARCARVSYLTHDKKVPNHAKDIELHDDLVSSVPIHASPAEHQAWPTHDLGRYANFVGWVQYRKDVESRVRSGLIANQK